MAKFKYRSHGTANDWVEDTIEADDEKDAMRKLDKLYGIERDETGAQLNADMIKVELIK